MMNIDVSLLEQLKLNNTNIIFQCHIYKTEADVVRLSSKNLAGHYPLIKSISGNSFTWNIFGNNNITKSTPSIKLVNYSFQDYTLASEVSLYIGKKIELFIGFDDLATNFMFYRGKIENVSLNGDELSLDISNDDIGEEIISGRAFTYDKYTKKYKLGGVDISNIVEFTEYEAPPGNFYTNVVNGTMSFAKEFNNIHLPKVYNRNLFSPILKLGIINSTDDEGYLLCSNDIFGEASLLNSYDYFRDTSDYIKLFIKNGENFTPYYQYNYLRLSGSNFYDVPNFNDPDKHATIKRFYANLLGGSWNAKFIYIPSKWLRTNGNVVENQGVTKDMNEIYNVMPYKLDKEVNYNLLYDQYYGITLLPHVRRNFINNFEKVLNKDNYFSASVDVGMVGVIGVKSGSQWDVGTVFRINKARNFNFVNNYLIPNGIGSTFDTSNFDGQTLIFGTGRMEFGLTIPAVVSFYHMFYVNLCDRLYTKDWEIYDQGVISKTNFLAEEEYYPYTNVIYNKHLSLQPDYGFNFGSSIKFLDQYNDATSFQTLSFVASVGDLGDENKVKRVGSLYYPEWPFETGIQSSSGYLPYLNKDFVDKDYYINIGYRGLLIAEQPSYANVRLDYLYLTRMGYMSFDDVFAPMEGLYLNQPPIKMLKSIFSSNGYTIDNNSYTIAEDRFNSYFNTSRDYSGFTLTEETKLNNFGKEYIQYEPYSYFLENNNVFFVSLKPNYTVGDINLEIKYEDILDFTQNYSDPSHIINEITLNTENLNKEYNQKLEYYINNHNYNYWGNIGVKKKEITKQYTGIGDIDVVSYGGKKYQCIRTNNKKQPDINPDYWLEYIPTFVGSFKTWNLNEIFNGFDSENYKLASSILNFYSNRKLVINFTTIDYRGFTLQIGDIISFADVPFRALGFMDLKGFNKNTTHFTKNVNGQIVYSCFIITKIKKNINKVEIECVQCNSNSYTIKSRLFPEAIEEVE